jgi:hypothetical protein
MVNRGERRECVKPRADAPAQLAAVGCSVRPRSPPPGLWPERQLLGAHEGRIADAYEAKQLADVHAALLGGAISAEATHCSHPAFGRRHNRHLLQAHASEHLNPPLPAHSVALR